MWAAIRAFPCSLEQVHSISADAPGFTIVYVLMLMTLKPKKFWEN